MTFFHPTAPRNRKNYTYLFFRNSDLKCPKMPLSALIFLQITFFSSLLLLLTSATLPNHLFRQTSDQKWSKNFPKGGTIFFLFFIIFFTFSLSSSRNKQNHLLFPSFLSSETEKPQGKMSHKKFFFFFFTFLHPTAPRNREKYHLPFFFEIPT